MRQLEFGRRETRETPGSPPTYPETSACYRGTTRVNDSERTAAKPANTTPKGNRAAGDCQSFFRQIRALGADATPHRYGTGDAFTVLPDRTGKSEIRGVSR